MGRSSESGYAVLWSGGKDSCLALWKARQSGLRVAALVNFFDQATNRVRFHGNRAELVKEQASSLGLEVFQYPTRPESFSSSFEQALVEIRRIGLQGVIAGDIHLENVRQWNQEKASTAGLKLVEPLWHRSGHSLLNEFIAAGFRAIVTCCDESWPTVLWPGRDIDQTFLADVSRADCIDPCGENGEYHSFVFDGPLFSRSLSYRTGDVRRSNRFAQIDILMKRVGG